ncbi:aspartate-semialdehyde dehydrogenase [Thermodesulfobacteriota bacterium]
MRKEAYNVAVVGATGAVGDEMIAILEERNFPIENLIPLASSRSADKTIDYRGRNIAVKVLDEDSFENVDIALFSAGGSISEKYGPIAAAAGAIVIDNSSAFRMVDDIPLVVPEVNPDKIAEFENKGIIANPNCSTIQMVVALAPIHKKAGIERLVISTYQATSGAGKKAMEELFSQTLAIFQQEDIVIENFTSQIAFNCIPHIDVFLDNDYTKEEMKMVHETRKILGDDSIKITATAVRVPVFFSHSESVNVETKDKITADEVKKLLESAPGIRLVDDTKNNEYPMPVDAAGSDDTLVGRIRNDESIENGLNLWIVSDNIRKGAALNAVQIAEVLVDKYI